jgi:sulfur relay (sulfurtransferase) DsrC/TusE family protein
MPFLAEVTVQNKHYKIILNEKKYFIQYKVVPQGLPLLTSLFNTYLDELLNITDSFNIRYMHMSMT